MAGPSSSHAALLVLAVSLLLVCHLVGALPEGLGTDAAAEGSLPRVAAHVVDQCGSLGECHGAEVATIGPIARVNAQVDVQVALF